MKKLRLLTTLLCTAIFTLSLVSCAGDSSSPSDVAIITTEALQNGDIDTFLEYINTTPEKKDGIKALFTEKVAKEIKAELDKKNGVKSVVATNETISKDGNSAEVRVETIYNNGTSEEQNLKLINIDGKWMIEDPLKDK